MNLTVPFCLTLFMPWHALLFSTRLFWVYRGVPFGCVFCRVFICPTFFRQDFFGEPGVYLGNFFCRVRQDFLACSRILFWVCFRLLLTHLFCRALFTHFFYVRLFWSVGVSLGYAFFAIFCRDFLACSGILLWMCFLPSFD